MLPLGTGNDLARALRMPLDVEPAMVALASAQQEGRLIGMDLLELTHGQTKSVCANSVHGGIAPLIQAKFGDIFKSDCVDHIRCRELEIVEQPSDLDFTADGEALGEPLQAIRILPGALRAVVGEG